MIVGAVVERELKGSMERKAIRVIRVYKDLKVRRVRRVIQGIEENPLDWIHCIYWVVYQGLAF